MSPRPFDVDALNNYSTSTCTSLHLFHMIHQFKEIHNDKNTTIQYALSDLSRSFSFRLIVACFLV